MWQLPDTLDYAICGSYLPLYALYYVTSNRHVSFAVVCTMWQLPDTLYHALCDSYQTLSAIHYVTATRLYMLCTMWQLPHTLCHALCDNLYTLYDMHYVTWLSCILVTGTEMNTFSRQRHPLIQTFYLLIPPFLSHSLSLTPPSLSLSLPLFHSLFPSFPSNYLSLSLTFSQMVLLLEEKWLLTVGIEMQIRIRIRLLIFMDTDPKIIHRRFASCLVLFQRVVHGQKSNPNIRDITLNVEGNMILNEIFRVVLRFPRYISCYIAESRFPLGQCNKFANHMVCFYTMQKKKNLFSAFKLIWTPKRTHSPLPHLRR